LPHLILKQDKSVRLKLQERWQHILIDEFQDTNPVQFEFVKLLCPSKNLQEQEENKVPSRGIFVVGDDAQSIYGFRGSKIEIILNFESEYPGTKEIILNQNYRSTQSILDLAEKVISHNSHQKKKYLFTDNKEDIKIKYYTARNEKDEAEYIIKQIYQQYVLKQEMRQEVDKENLKTEEVEFIPEPEYLASQNKIKFKSKDPISRIFDVSLDDDSNFDTVASVAGLSKYNFDSWQVPSYNWQNLKELNDCVILYRTHSQSRSLEETFLKYRMPYRLVSGVRFLDRKEIKDVIAMLRFLSNGEDKISLSRFLPLILDGVGPKTLQKIIAYLQDFDYPLASKYKEKLLDVLQKFQSVWLENDNLISLTKHLISLTGYENYLKKIYPIKEEREARMENLGEIYSLMSPFDEDKETELPIRLQRFLEHIALMSSLDNKIDEDSPKINLMSLHQSKGLEFETVFLVGVEDGLLPHQNSFLEPDGIEEEVRLAYVGITRAKKYLHLISAQSRVQFGQVQANPVSRIFRPFLDTHCYKVSF
jgi:superfamily I DNA/RNA helicase